MSALKVGDVCEVVFVYMSRHNFMIGKQVTIRRLGVSGFDSRTMIERHDFIDADGGVEGRLLLAEQLRRIPPKQDEQFTAGEWELCPWQPNKQKERA